MKTDGRLYLYLCCRRTPRWPFSTWRSAPGPGWLYWGRRNRGTGWRSTSPGCPTLDASIWSARGGPPKHYRWIGPRWPMSCARVQRWPPRRETAGRTLVGSDKRKKWPVSFMLWVFTKCVSTIKLNLNYFHSFQKVSDSIPVLRSKHMATSK